MAIINTIDNHHSRRVVQVASDKPTRLFHQPCVYSQSLSFDKGNHLNKMSVPSNGYGLHHRFSVAFSHVTRHASQKHVYCVPTEVSPSPPPPLPIRRRNGNSYILAAAVGQKSRWPPPPRQHCCTRKSSEDGRDIKCGDWSDVSLRNLIQERPRSRQTAERMK